MLAELRRSREEYLLAMMPLLMDWTMRIERFICL